MMHPPQSFGFLAQLSKGEISFSMPRTVDIVVYMTRRVGERQLEHFSSMLNKLTLYWNSTGQDLEHSCKPQGQLNCMPHHALTLPRGVLYLKFGQNFVKYHLVIPSGPCRENCLLDRSLAQNKALRQIPSRTLTLLVLLHCLRFLAPHLALTP